MPEAARQKALEFEEARQMVIEIVRSLGSKQAIESVPLEQAHGRVLAEPLLADRDYPALRRSLRDGFAVKSSDVPGTLRIRGEVRAGEEQQAPLQDGEALEIMTGAPVPEGADAVVMVEHVTRMNDPQERIAGQNRAARRGGPIHQPAGRRSATGIGPDPERHAARCQPHSHAGDDRQHVCARLGAPIGRDPGHGR